MSEQSARTGSEHRTLKMEPPIRSTTQPWRRVDVLGVQVSAISPRIAIEEIDRRVRQQDPGYVTFTGVHGVMESQADPALRAIHNRASLICPDGMPLVWAARSAGAPDCQRVCGPDLMLAVWERSADLGWRHFLYGGRDGVAELLAKRLQERFPGVQIAGTWTPPFRPLTEGEFDDIAAMINRSRAQLVWVGLSTPKQERWMAAMRSRLEAPVLLGVGAAFDINAGLVPRAPAWMQRNGLEWLFRMASEPRRLARRYLTNNPRFVLRMIRSRPVLLTGETQ